MRSKWTVIKHPPRRSFTRICKRVFDLTVVLVVAVPAASFVAVVAILIRYQTRTGPFLVQTRQTADGRRLRILKLQTLIRKQPHLPRVRVFSIKILKQESDYSIYWTTRIGIMLRRAHLDELPQLLNVAWGEMSIVGPRPLVPREHYQWRTREAYPANCSGGLTCMYELVRDRGDDFHRRNRWDQWYLRHEWVGLDVWIVAKTFALVLKERFTLKKQVNDAHCN